MWGWALDSRLMIERTLFDFCAGPGEMALLTSENGRQYVVRACDVRPNRAKIANASTGDVHRVKYVLATLNVPPSRSCA